MKTSSLETPTPLPRPDLHVNLTDATFLLTVTSFMLTVEFLCLQLCFGFFSTLQSELFGFLLAIGAFLLAVGASVSEHKTDCK